MPRNDAAVDLQFLQRQQLDAQQARDNLNAVQASQINPGVLDAARAQAAGEEPPTAAFSAPEAVATAVGASLILGPVGGLLMGAAQGILGKQAKQNAMDQFAAEQSALDEATTVIEDNFDALEANARTPEDVAQINNLRAQNEAAMKLMRSPSVRLQKQGAQLFAATQASTTAFAEQNEADAIAREAAEQEAIRAMGQEGYNRYQAAQADYDVQTAPLEEIHRRANEVIALLDDGTNASISAALTALAKLQDPESVVRESERDLYTNLMGAVDELAQGIVGLADGEKMGPETRREVIDTVQKLRALNHRNQMEVDARFVDRLDDAQQEGVAVIPDRYYDNFQRAQQRFFQEPIDLYRDDQGQLPEGAENTNFPDAVSNFTKTVTPLQWARRLTANALEYYFPGNRETEERISRQRRIQGSDDSGRIERITN